MMEPGDPKSLPSVGDKALAGATSLGNIALGAAMMVLLLTVVPWLLGVSLVGAIVISAPASALFVLAAYLTGKWQAFHRLAGKPVRVRGLDLGSTEVMRAPPSPRPQIPVRSAKWFWRRRILVSEATLESYREHPVRLALMLCHDTDHWKLWESCARAPTFVRIGLEGWAEILHGHGGFAGLISVVFPKPPEKRGDLWLLWFHARGLLIAPYALVRWALALLADVARPPSFGRSFVEQILRATESEHDLNAAKQLREALKGVTVAGGNEVGPDEIWIDLTRVAAGDIIAAVYACARHETAAHPDAATRARFVADALDHPGSIESLTSRSREEIPAVATATAPEASPARSDKPHVCEFKPPLAALDGRPEIAELLAQVVSPRNDLDSLLTKPLNQAVSKRIFGLEPPCTACHGKKPLDDNVRYVFHEAGHLRYCAVLCKKHAVLTLLRERFASALALAAVFAVILGFTGWTIGLVRAGWNLGNVLPGGLRLDWVSDAAFSWPGIAVLLATLFIYVRVPVIAKWTFVFSLTIPASVTALLVICAGLAWVQVDDRGVHLGFERGSGLIRVELGMDTPVSAPPPPPEPAAALAPKPSAASAPKHLPGFDSLLIRAAKAEKRVAPATEASKPPAEIHPVAIGSVIRGSVTGAAGSIHPVPMAYGARAAAIGVLFSAPGEQPDDRGQIAVRDAQFSAKPIDVSEHLSGTFLTVTAEEREVEAEPKRASFLYRESKRRTMQTLTKRDGNILYRVTSVDPNPTIAQARLFDFAKSVRFRPVVRGAAPWVWFGQVATLAIILVSFRMLATLLSFLPGMLRR